MNLYSAQVDESIKKHRPSLDNGETTLTKRHLLIMLAPESPHISKNFDDIYDESTYDSFHNFETDVCRDSSDDEKSCSGSSTDEFSVDIVEYEVPSDSEDEDVEKSSASSGDEEDYQCFMKKIKVVEYEFNQTTTEDEYILADTSSDSDGSVLDPELGPADYWCCLRCRNPSNNPLYSFCEKCFQERRELFPPRPRGRRKNSKSPSVKRKPTRMSKRDKCDDTVSESEEEEPTPKRAALSRSNVSSGSHSNGNQVNFLSENNKSYKSDDYVSPTKVSSSDDESESPVALIEPTSSSSSIELQSVVKSSRTNNELGLRIENKFIKNVYRQDVPKNVDSKDSGMSSCQESSQELSDGMIGRTTSSSSTQSFDSQYTEAATQLVVSDDEDQQILQRAEEFSEKAKEFDATETHLGICNFCMSNKKDGVFVHSNCLHLCCCYKCAVKVWKKRKCCPICNQKIKNVSKLFVH